MMTLKDIGDLISEPLVHIFKLYIEKSIRPNSLKYAEVIPIFKSGNKHEISNYRPISIISNLAKIFEKIIFNRL